VKEKKPEHLAIRCDGCSREKRKEVSDYVRFIEGRYASTRKLKFFRKLLGESKRTESGTAALKTLEVFFSKWGGEGEKVGSRNQTLCPTREDGREECIEDDVFSFVSSQSTLKPNGNGK